MKVVPAGDAGKFECAFDHAQRRVAVAIHDPITERAMIRPDANGAIELFALEHERCEFFFNAAQFLVVLLVRVFQDGEVFLVGVVAGVDAHLLDPIGGLHGGGGLEMDIRDEGRVAAFLAQAIDDVLQIGGDLCVLGGDADELAADVDERESLLDAGLSVLRVAGEHGLGDDGVVSADNNAARLGGANPPLAGESTMIEIGRFAVLHEISRRG